MMGGRRRRKAIVCAYTSSNSMILEADAKPEFERPV